MTGKYTQAAAMVDTTSRIRVSLDSVVYSFQRGILRTIQAEYHS